MSEKLQDITNIAPLASENKGEKPKNPVQADYEQGKKYLENNDYGQAAVALHNALLGFEEGGNEEGIANASNQLGHVCLAKEDYDSAAKHYQRAWDICEKLEDPISQVAISKQFIEVHRGQKDFAAAINTCLDLLDNYRNNNDPRGTVALLEKMADIYVDSGQSAKAADTYRTMASIHRNFNHTATAEKLIKKADELEAGEA